MLYRLAVDLTVLVHFLFVLFVIFGVLAAWKLPVIKWFHVAAMGYGLLIEIFNWYCPLTHLEQYLRRQGGLGGYEGSFIPRYLNRVIYMDVPQWSLVTGAVVVVVVNLALYRRVGRQKLGRRD